MCVVCCKVIGYLRLAEARDPFLDKHISRPIRYSGLTSYPKAWQATSELAFKLILTLRFLSIYSFIIIIIVLLVLWACVRICRLAPALI